MRTNAPLDQGQPFDPSQVESANPPKVSEEERLIAKVGVSKEWQFILDYLKNRTEYYRAFLPAVSPEGGASADGVANTKLSNEKLGERWRSATTIIGEIEGLISQVETITNAVKRSGL